MSKIVKVWAREILDSRGLPTVEVVCQADSGVVALASAPEGTSEGSHEAMEIRDNDPLRYRGKGVLKAVESVNKILGPGIIGMDPANLEEVDKKLREMDGTENLSRFGENSILPLSVAVTKLGSLVSGQTLYSWIFLLCQRVGLTSSPGMPTPIFNMINGGLHGAGNLDFQEFHVIPASSKAFHEGLQLGSEIYMAIGENLARRGAIHSVGAEGGYAPNLFTNADAFEILVESIKQTSYSLGRDVFLGLDVAANSFYKNGEYTIRDKSSPMDDNQLLEYFKNLNDQYKLAILEDPFYEDAWESWKKISDLFKGQLTIVGDDLLVTNPGRIDKALEYSACNAILVKPNQIGTVTQTLQVIKKARDANWKIIVSHRSGETNDTFIADFAVGVGSDYVKFGAPARGERIAKYNRLLSIENEISQVVTK